MKGLRVNNGMEVSAVTFPLKVLNPSREGFSRQ